VKRRTAPLLVEALEDRTCPSLTYHVLPGNLIIRGRPTADLNITGVGGPGGHLFQVQQGLNIHTFNVPGNLIIQMPRRAFDINIDLNDQVIGGNLILDLGTGYKGANPDFSVDIFDGNGGTVGAIGGNLLLLRGNGRETFNIGGSQAGAPPATVQPVFIGGNVQAVGARSAGGSLGTGDNFTILDGTRVGGSVTTYLMDGVSIGQQLLGGTGASIGGDVTINNYGSGAALRANVFGTVGRNVSVSGTNSYVDTFTLGLTDVGVGGTINGRLNVNLYNSDLVGQSVTLQEGTVVNNSVSITTGQNPDGLPGDLVVFSGTINGSAHVNMGEGPNALDFSAVGSTPVITGNLTINGGNGVNTIFSTFPGNLPGMVGGDLRMTLGNGDNVLTLDGTYNGNVIMNLGSGANTISDTTTSFIGGTWRIRTSNGDNSVTLNSAQLYVLDFVFGNGDDTVTFTNASFVTGLLDGGGRITANTLNQGPATFLPTLVVVNFP
jgi:hypothetical protein